MASSTGPKGIDWDAERTAYVTGTETLDEVAARLGVNAKTVERMASSKHALNAGETWGEKRAAYRATAAIKSEQRAGDAVASTLARVREKASAVAEKALLELERRLDENITVTLGEDGWEATPFETKDLIATAKLATSVKVELGGDPTGVPVELAGKLNDLTLKELRKLAGEA